MRLGNPIRIAEGVHQIRAIGARVTVLTDGQSTVLVDTGAKGSLGPIADGLGSLDLGLDQVRLIVLTHHHPDHSGSLYRLAGATSAKVAVHREDAGIVTGEESVPSPYRNKLVAGITRPLMGALYGRPIEVDLLLEDGESLPFLEGVTVVHTPGHTAGSICLHMASTGVLIVGDALQYRLRRLSPPASLVTQDPAQALESLEKLLSLEFDTISFSHFPPLRDGAKDALRRLVEGKAVPRP